MFFDDEEPFVLPAVELRIALRDGSYLHRAVKEGLTIGRAAANDVIIEAPSVNLIHARITMGQRQWIVRAVGRSQIGLEDMSSTDELKIKPGSVFFIGGCPVQCLEPVKCDHLEVRTEHRARLAYDAKGRQAGDGEDDAFGGVPLTICPTCRGDLADVGVVARYCPMCGVELPARNAEGFLIPPPEDSPLFPVYRALREELSAKLKDESPQAATSLIILAYANALLKLGWQYEHGRGVLRNIEEAGRCYAKAGKLSEAWER